MIDHVARTFCTLSWRWKQYFTPNRWYPLPGYTVSYSIRHQYESSPQLNFRIFFYNKTSRFLEIHRHIGQYYLHMYVRSLDSLVSILVGYNLYIMGSLPWGGWNFSLCHYLRPGLGPTRSAGTGGYLLWECVELYLHCPHTYACHGAQFSGEWI